MIHYKMPNIFAHLSMRTYLAEFMELNSQKKGFSQRFLSKKLKWPVSYIPSLLKASKNFTVNRAIQFSECFKLGPIDLERLIYFALIDSDYIQATDKIKKILDIKAPTNPQKSKDFDLLDANVLLVFSTIPVLKNHATLKNLQKLIAHKGIPSTEVKNICQLLLEKKLIKIEDQVLIPLVSGIHGYVDDPDSENKTKNFHLDMYDFQKKYLLDLGGPASIDNGFYYLDKNRFNDITERMTSLRNWIKELSAEDKQKPVGDNMMLFQLDLTLAPVYSREILKNQIE